MVIVLIKVDWNTYESIVVNVSGKVMLENNDESNVLISKTEIGSGILISPVLRQPRNASFVIDVVSGWNMISSSIPHGQQRRDWLLCEYNMPLFEIKLGLSSSTMIVLRYSMILNAPLIIDVTLFGIKKLSILKEENA